MSEYTNIYLRKKGVPLLKYRTIADEDTSSLTKEEYFSLVEEVKAYNKSINEGLGCELFYLGTTPSRQLQVLPWSPDPQLLTTQMLQEILDFYSEEIEEEMQYIKRNEEELRILEDRIRSADVKLYDKIDQNIFETRSSINDSNDTLEELRSLMRRFEFVANMMQDTDNAERYELVYTKS
ncbi:MAG: hypothetical protein KBT08_07265 [Bacteroidales bacterium]|nr:hypothetical protein [Candidatus Cryptobacteroides onthequi]